MTPQEIFFRAAKHLLTQNAKSFVPYGTNGQTNGCLYRDPDGHKCAIGALIPDELYDPGMETKSADDLFDDFPDVMAECGLDRKDIGLLEDLQHCHDNFEPHQWLAELEHISATNGLDMIATITDIPEVERD